MITTYEINKIISLDDIAQILEPEHKEYTKDLHGISIFTDFSKYYELKYMAEFNILTAWNYIRRMNQYFSLSIIDVDTRDIYRFIIQEGKVFYHISNENNDLIGEYEKSSEVEIAAINYLQQNRKKSARS